MITYVSRDFLTTLFIDCNVKVNAPCCLHIDAPCYDPVLFEQLTGDLVRWAALHTYSAAGPSGVDAYACMAKIACVPLLAHPL